MALDEWLLDSVMIDRILAAAVALSELSQPELWARKPSLLDPEGMHGGTDPSGVRAALRQAARTDPRSRSFCLLVERAVLESAAFHAELTLYAWRGASTGLAQSLRARLKPVALVEGKDLDEQLRAWLKSHPRQELEGPGVPPSGRWFAERIAAVSPLSRNLKALPGAEPMSQYDREEAAIVADLERYLASATWNG